MIEAELLNYGVLGVWTIINLITIKQYRDKQEKKEDRLIEVINNNTIALTRFYENSKRCLR